MVSAKRSGLSGLCGCGEVKLVEQLILEPEPAFFKHLDLGFRGDLEGAFDPADAPVDGVVLVDEFPERALFLFEFEDEVAVFGEFNQHGMMEVHRSSDGGET
jgi:hypothetical protein